MGLAKRLERALAEVPHRYAGPGGAVAVLRADEVLARRTWGWADAERRIAFTPQSLFRMCSITKQFTCAVMLDQFPDPTVLQDDLRRMLPRLEVAAPEVVHLAHNQSGFRDYWATAMLSGAPVEGVFTDADARALIGRTRTLHFEPGTRYSYCNQNFRILSDIVQERTGRSYAELLRARVFNPAGMPLAILAAEGSALPDGTVGYEGSLEGGFRVAVNNINWTGDAGLGASLDDMIAWEKFIDASRDDADSLYGRIARPVAFKDGAPAFYGFGLARGKLHGQVIVSHGGGLRGWRSFRFYAPETRISIVAMFNHMADPRAAAAELFAAILDVPASVPPVVADPGWDGRYIEPETGIAVRLDMQEDRNIKMQYGSGPEMLSAVAEKEFAGGGRLYEKDGALWMDRAVDHQSTALGKVSGAPAEDIAGSYRSVELEATLTCVSAGGVLYGAFSGDLGKGEMQKLLPYAEDIWLLPCARALDFSPPGDWTVHVRRDAAGAVRGLEIGCWLARRVAFDRV